MAEGQIFIYTPTQEEELVDWFLDNTLFYNKSSTHFKSRVKKEGL